MQQPKIPTKKETTILQHLQNKENITNIAKTLKISRNTTYKHIRKLIKKGLLKRIENRGGYNLMPYHTTDVFRLHGIMVFYELPVGIDRFKWKKNRGRVLSLKHVTYDRITLKNKVMVTDVAPRFYLFDVYECRAHANGVLVFMPEIKAENPCEAEYHLLLKIKAVGLQLNKLFKVDFFKEGTLRIKIVGCEFAHVEDQVAKVLRLDKKKLYISLEGELRLVADYSWQLDELEAVSVGMGLSDTMAVQRYVRSILANPYVLTPDQVTKQIYASGANFKLMSDNFRGVEEVLRNVEGVVKQLAIAVARLEGERFKS